MAKTKEEYIAELAERQQTISTTEKEVKKMKTLMFCTCYVNDEDSYERYKRWLDFYVPRKEALGINKIMMVDDGSPSEWLLKLTSEYDMIVKPYYEKWDYNIDEDESAITMISFTKNYGRPMMLLVPGWWRSFSVVGPISLANEYEKVIHLESDLFVLSKALTDKIREFDYGWYTGWCNKLGYMESSLQVIIGDKRFVLNDYWKAGKNFWFKQNLNEYQYAPEYVLAPHVTNNTKDDRFLGDRYGDDFFQEEEIPEDADYIANTHDISLHKQLQKNIAPKAALFQLMMKQSDNVILKGKYPKVETVPKDDVYSDIEFNATKIYENLEAMIFIVIKRHLGWILQPAHSVPQPDKSTILLPLASTRIRNLLEAKDPDAETMRIIRAMAVDLVKLYIEHMIEKKENEI